MFHSSVSKILTVKMAQPVLSDLIKIFQTSVSAVLPENLINNYIKYNPVNQCVTIIGENHNLQHKNVYLVGTGKAVQSMAKEVENILGSNIKYGIISIPEGSLNRQSAKGNVLYYEGAQNNLPDANAVKTSKKVYDLVMKLGTDDLLLVLISGGGSALLSLPKEPISLEEKKDLIKKLANAGADIKDLNTVRKRLSGIKGGQLAINAQPAKVVSLILSDIVGDPLDLIASGPTVENKDHPSEAMNIIKKFNIYDGLSDSIKIVLKDTQDSKLFPTENVSNYIIGSNKLSIEAAVNEAKTLNYHPIELSNIVTGNVEEVAKEYTKLVKVFCDYLKGKTEKCNMLLQVQALKIPGINVDVADIDYNKDKDFCLILGGEITVEVKGSGKGGRNQHLALEFSKYINEMKNDFDKFEIYLLSAGTDGIDGPTDAAGAIGYLDLVSDSIKEGLDVNKYLESNNSYNFFKDFRKGGLHVITGHTNTNVMDIHLILIKNIQ